MYSRAPLWSAGSSGAKLITGSGQLHPSTTFVAAGTVSASASPHAGSGQRPTSAAVGGGSGSTLFTSRAASVASAPARRSSIGRSASASAAPLAGPVPPPKLRGPDSVGSVAELRAWTAQQGTAASELVEPPSQQQAIISNWQGSSTAGSQHMFQSDSTHFAPSFGFPEDLLLVLGSSQNGPASASQHPSASQCEDAGGVVALEGVMQWEGFAPGGVGNQRALASASSAAAAATASSRLLERGIPGTSQPEAAGGSGEGPRQQHAELDWFAAAASALAGGELAWHDVEVVPVRDPVTGKNVGSPYMFRA